MTQSSRPCAVVIVQNHVGKRTVSGGQPRGRRLVLGKNAAVVPAVRREGDVSLRALRDEHIQDRVLLTGEIIEPVHEHKFPGKKGLVRQLGGKLRERVVCI